jgi:hypothetical protein
MVNTTSLSRCSVWEECEQRGLTFSRKVKVHP